MSLLGPMESLYGRNCYGVPSARNENHSRIFECALLYTVPNFLQSFYIQTHSAIPREAKIHACRCVDWAKLSEALREAAAANEDIPDHVRMQVKHAKSFFRILVKQVANHPLTMTVRYNDGLISPDLTLCFM